MRCTSSHFGRLLHTFHAWLCVQLLLYLHFRSDKKISAREKIIITHLGLPPLYH